MSGEIGGGIDAPLAFVIDEDDGGVFVPMAEHLLHHLLREVEGAFDACGLVLFGHADIDHLPFFAVFGLPLLLEFLGADLDLEICLVARKDVADDFLDGEVSIADADFGEGFGGLEAAARATSYVVAPEKRAAGTGKGRFQVAHGDLRINFARHRMGTILPRWHSGNPHPQNMLPALEEDTFQETSPVAFKEGKVSGPPSFFCFAGPRERYAPYSMKALFPSAALLLASLCGAAAASLTLSAPLDYEVLQRSSKEAGTIQIEGRLAEATPESEDVVEARVVADGKTPEWKALKATFSGNDFHAALAAPAGGWYRMEVRVKRGENVVAEDTVDHVGLGEVFIVAGQSNSANHGEEKLKTETGLVAESDGKRWQLANDPQPGASGTGGSFLPPFGDAIVKLCGVPVGLIACGSGGTSVRHWLPKGDRSPYLPTYAVSKLPSNEWESDGSLFNTLVARMKAEGPHGFRAVLWHQGESDGNQPNPASNLPGKLYREYMERLIRESSREIGWEPTWFVAQVSYHGPGDESAPDIRAAQAALWKEGIAKEGPDTDTLKEQNRDTGGKGIHFSGAGQRAHAALWVEKVGPWLERQ